LVPSCSRWVNQAKHDPSNLQWQRDLAIGHDLIAEALSAAKQNEEALVHFRKVVEIRENLTATIDRGNTQWQRDLSGAYINVGQALAAQGKLDEALQSYRQGLAIAERLAALNRSNTQWQDDLQFVIGKIGALAYEFVLARDFATALTAADQAISLAPEEIWLYTNRAHALMFLGRVDEARALYLKYRDEKNVQNGKAWVTVILEDFAEMQKIGLASPLMDDIEKQFVAKG
jgi:tetratricopeptide (TPR) repeat protein